IVALRATERRPHPYGHGSVDAIDNRFVPKLLVVSSPLSIRHRIAMESSSDFLIARWIRQQITRELLDGKLVEWQIPIERADHPITVGPHASAIIFFVALRVGISRQIQPGTRPSFPEMRGSQQPIDQ